MEGTSEARAKFVCMWEPLVLSTVAGLGTVLGGGLLLILVQESSTKSSQKDVYQETPPGLLLARLQAACAGVMTAIGLELLLVEGLPHLGLFYSLLWMSLGVLFILLLNLILPTDETLAAWLVPAVRDVDLEDRVSTTQSPQQTQLLRSSAVIFTGMALHNFPEGVFHSVVRVVGASATYMHTSAMYLYLIYQKPLSQSKASLWLSRQRPISTSEFLSASPFSSITSWKAWSLPFRSGTQPRVPVECSSSHF